MDSPRSGFRRAAATSWALAGLGVAGVAGASVLAYGDTVKPAPVAIPAVDTVATDPAVNLPPAPVPQVTPTPEPTVTQAPVQTSPPAPTYTQKPTPQQQAPAAPTTKAQSSFPIRQSHVPLGGGGTSGGNSFSPHVTVSRGS
jgi:hypothetical protein